MWNLLFNCHYHVSCSHVSQVEKNNEKFYNLFNRKNTKITNEIYPPFLIPSLMCSSSDTIKGSVVLVVCCSHEENTVFMSSSLMSSGCQGKGQNSNELS